MLKRIEGRAVVRALRMRWESPEAPATTPPPLIVLFDFETTPSIRMRLDDFFGQSSRSPRLGRSADGWAYCHLPMPFARSVEIAIANPGPGLLRIEGEVEAEKAMRRDLPERTLHARVMEDVGPEEAMPIEGPGRFVGALWRRMGNTTDSLVLFADDLTSHVLASASAPNPRVQDARGDATEEVFLDRYDDPIVFERSLRLSFGAANGQERESRGRVTVYWYRDKTPEDGPSDRPEVERAPRTPRPRTDRFRQHPRDGG
jgi:hypothetical protein